MDTVLRIWGCSGNRETMLTGRMQQQCHFAPLILMLQRRVKTGTRLSHTHKHHTSFTLVSSALLLYWSPAHLRWWRKRFLPLQASKSEGSLLPKHSLCMQFKSQTILSYQHNGLREILGWNKALVQKLNGHVNCFFFSFKKLPTGQMPPIHHG